MKEVWKNIDSYTGIYQISNKGEVKRLERTSSNNRTWKEKTIKTRINPEGYVIVDLYNKKKEKN